MAGFFLFSYSEVSVKCEGYRLMSVNEMIYMYVCVIGLIERNKKQKHKCKQRDAKPTQT